MFLENLNSGVQHSGWIEVITGSMFSGKTEELIRRLNRARIARQKVEIFKPIIDTRYSKTDIVSHNDNSVGGIAVESSERMLLLCGDIDVVGIDEAQFFDSELTRVCETLANRGVRVIVAGLDLNYAGQPFGPMPQLMAAAEFVTKVHAICIKCGKLAHYSHRLLPNDDLVLLGEKLTYEPLCRKCFLSVNRINC